MEIKNLKNKYVYITLNKNVYYDNTFDAFAKWVI